LPARPYPRKLIWDLHLTVARRNRLRDWLPQCPAHLGRRQADVDTSVEQALKLSRS
jgi:hypothetical protein